MWRQPVVLASGKPDTTGGMTVEVGVGVGVGVAVAVGAGVGVEAADVVVVGWGAADVVVVAVGFAVVVVGVGEGLLLSLVVGEAVGVGDADTVGRCLRKYSAEKVACFCACGEVTAATLAPVVAEYPKAVAETRAMPSAMVVVLAAARCRGRAGVTLRLAGALEEGVCARRSGV